MCIRDSGGKEQTPKVEGTRAQKPDFEHEPEMEDLEQGQQENSIPMPEAARRVFGLNQIDQDLKSPDLDVTDL